MSDDHMISGNSEIAPEAAPTVTPAARPRIDAGRAALIAAAALVVLAAIGGIVFWVLTSFQNVVPVATAPTVPITGTPGTTASGTGSTTASGAVLPIPDVQNADVFTPRNPFEVIAAPTIESTSSSSGSGSTETSTSSTALVLSDITSVAGVKKAVVKLGGVTYTVGEGDTVGTSNWQVVQINTSSVVFLYGDDRVTISLGTGSSK